MENPVFVYIEDDPASRMVVQVIMKRVLKYEHLTIFPDSRDIMARINALDPQPNVMFIDIQMKPHDGYQVLQLLRADERYADALIVAMTANVMSHDVEQLRKAGFDGLIGKPILQDSFPGLVQRILEGQSIWYVPG